MRAVRAALPNEDLVYLGDTARVPYGNRSAATVRRYANNATALLVDRGVKALVVACNTATAYALPSLRKAYELPVVGVVEPVAERAASITQTGQVAVLGTRGTIASGCYQDALTRLGVRAVHQHACPLLVPLAEEGWLDGDIADAVARRYVAPLADTEIDALILGCTHYPLLVHTITTAVSEVTGREVAILDCATATARSLVETLQADGLLSQQGDGSEQFLATDDVESFSASATRFLGREARDVEHVDIVDVSSRG
jgi:glutamate racemase